MQIRKSKECTMYMIITQPVNNAKTTTEARTHIECEQRDDFALSVGLQLYIHVFPFGSVSKGPFQSPYLS